MVWSMSTVRDISHHQTGINYAAFRSNTNSVQIKITESTDFVDDAAWSNGVPGRHYRGCAGISRAPYHFARPVSVQQQIAHFLNIKRSIGNWERVDMLDCEFAGVTGAFIRALKDEYRRQSGISRVQIYVGLHDLITSCPPNQWWDADVYIQAARYRKIGAPDNPDDWRTHLGFDHPGLSTYQWDNAWPFYPGGPVGDISYDRIVVGGKAMAGLDDQNATYQDLIFRVLALVRGDETQLGGSANEKGKALEMIVHLKTALGRIEALSLMNEDIRFGPTSGSEKSELVIALNHAIDLLEHMQVGGIDMDALAERVADRILAKLNLVQKA